MPKNSKHSVVFQQVPENNLNLFSGELHAFDTTLASLYGIEEAVVIHHFMHWIRINKRIGQNFLEGRTWTYQTQDWMIAHFPYFKNRNRLIRIIDHLVEIGVLLKGNFNKNKFDRTVWYAFKDENKFAQCIVQNRTMGCSETHNQELENEQCIYDKDTKPDAKDKKETTLKSSKENPSESLLCFGKFVVLSENSLKELVSRYGDEKVKEVIEEINDYLSSTGKKAYKDYAAAIRQWIRRAQSKHHSSAAKQNLTNTAQVDKNLKLVQECKSHYPEYFKDIRIFGSSHIISESQKAKDTGYDYAKLDMNPEEFERILYKMAAVKTE
jgi:hypothetical protein